MSVREISEKIKRALESDFFIVLLVVLVGLSGFGLGRLSLLEEKDSGIYIFERGNAAGSASVHEAVVQDIPEPIERAQNTAPASSGEGEVVASRNSDKYHYPWCSGAKRIKEENKVWYPSIEAARAAGLSPAGNCQGLQ